MNLPALLTVGAVLLAPPTPTAAASSTSARYTLTPPAGTNWMAPGFDDSAWTPADDPAAIPGVVPPSGEVWIRLRCELTWDLINNTYARILRTGPVELHVNGKPRRLSGDRLQGEGWRSVPLSPGREEQPGVNLYALHGKGPAGLQLVHEPWIPRTFPDLAPQALIDEPLRDANVIRGGDGNYYLTGTFAGTEGEGKLFFDYKSGRHWKNNNGVKLYRSPDLRHWTDLGWVWTFTNNATWCREPLKSDDPVKNGRQGVFAPKFHYLDGKYVIVYGVNWSASNHTMGVGIAIADRPEGPYRETSPDKPICSGYDAQIFRDDDGQRYLIRNHGQIARLKPDLSGLDGDERMLACENYPFVGFEGPGLIKRGNTYYLMAAEILARPGGGVMGCTMVATSTNVLGPYGRRYLLLSDGGGHTRPFQDRDGKWWTALWTWKKFSHQFGIIGMEFDADGTLRPNGQVIPAPPPRQPPTDNSPLPTAN